VPGATPIVSVVRGDRGASSLEYALLASLIAAVIVVSVALFGSAVVDLFDSGSMP